MARKSAFDDLVEITARFPWWVGVMLAVASYLWLHEIATTALVFNAKPAQIGQYAGHVLYVSMAKFGQYLLPFVFLLGAAASALGRFRRKNLLAHAAGNAGTAAIQHMTWQEFEMLIGEAFRQQGFKVQETATGADGGVDLELRNGQELHLVQCKHWRAGKVGVATVRELYGVMAARGAAGGYVITSGQFTQEAVAFAAGKSLSLIDGSALSFLIGRAKRTANVPQELAEFVMAGSPPLCPKCSSSMVKRVAKQGTHAGREFWGCSKYPGCRGIVAIHK